MDTVGTRIKKIREIRGYSQKYVADKIGIHVTLLQQYERGLKKPKEEQLQKIADALLVHADFLRLPKVDSPEAVLAMIYELLECYGNVSLDIQEDVYMIGIPRETAELRMRQYFSDAYQAREVFANRDFAQWLLNYYHSHAVTADFKTGEMKKQYPELEVYPSKPDGEDS